MTHWLTQAYQKSVYDYKFVLSLDKDKFLLNAKRPKSAQRMRFVSSKEDVPYNRIQRNMQTGSKCSMVYTSNVHAKQQLHEIQALDKGGTKHKSVAGDYVEK